jgi:hypothetical protein
MLAGDHTGVRLWNVATGRRWGTWRFRDARVLSVAFSPDGRFAAAGIRTNLHRERHAELDLVVRFPVDVHAWAG